MEENGSVGRDRAISGHEGPFVSLKAEADEVSKRNPYLPQWLKKIGLDKLPKGSFLT